MIFFCKNHAIYLTDCCDSGRLPFTWASLRQPEPGEIYRRTTPTTSRSSDPFVMRFEFIGACSNIHKNQLAATATELYSFFLSAQRCRAVQPSYFISSVDNFYSPPCFSVGLAVFAYLLAPPFTTKVFVSQSRKYTFQRQGW